MVAIVSCSDLFMRARRESHATLSLRAQPFKFDQIAGKEDKRINYTIITYRST